MSNVVAEFTINQPQTIETEFQINVANNDHNNLTNRDLADQHPISAITGLQEALDSVQSSWGHITGDLNDQTDLKDALDAKQDVISDLSEIRSGAALGATAVQSVTEGTANGTIKVGDNDVSVHGLGSAAYTASTAYDASGSASTAETNAKNYADGLASNYATSAQGALADTALQPNDNISELVNDSGYITDSALSGYATENYVDTADGALQTQIDALSAASDVTDIVGTYADLEAYDTTHLKDNDIIKVLQDETHDNETTYYRWNLHTETFTLIGEEGPYYTIASANSTFVPQTRKVNNKALSADITLTASDVGALPSNTQYVTTDTAQTISGSKAFSQPLVVADSVGLATGTILSNKKIIQKTSSGIEVGNGTEDLLLVGKSATTNPKYNGNDLALKSDVPTDTSDLTNNAGFITGITSSDVTTALGYTPYSDANPNGYTSNVGTVTSVNNTSPDSNGNITLSIPAAQVNSDWNAVSGVAEILNKPSLATVATTGAYSDLSGTPTIPTVNNATLTVTQNGVSAGTFTANASSDVTLALTDTTYSAFTGADGVNAGTAGLVPAPSATDNTKFLKGDGTWATVSGGGGSYTAGTGIDITGSVISVDAQATAEVDVQSIAEVDTESLQETTAEDLLKLITGYDANATQTLKNINGSIQWVTD